MFRSNIQSCWSIGRVSAGVFVVANVLKIGTCVYAEGGNDFGPDLLNRSYIQYILVLLLNFLHNIHLYKLT